MVAGLIDAGVLSNGARKTARGTQSVAEDGHICLSLAEKTTDDYSTPMAYRMNGK
jgi:hypothetical protein